MKGSRTKALLVFTFQCYIIYTFPADGSLHCQSDSIWTNLNDYLGSIILTIVVILRHLGILNPLSTPPQGISRKNIHIHSKSTPYPYPYGLSTPWRALIMSMVLIGKDRLIWPIWLFLKRYLTLPKSDLTPSKTFCWIRPWISLYKNSRQCFSLPGGYFLGINNRYR